jgi:Ser/Thr protein kinase RdoA (MazF antagonist)
MSADLLRPQLARYGLPPDTALTLLNRSENETWQAGDSLILRLHRQGYHTGAEIASELHWLTALQGQPGLRVVRPVPDLAGALVGRAGDRFLVGFQPIAGAELQVSDDLDHWFAPLGEVTARLHAQARTWTPPQGFARKRWDVATILGPAPHWGHWWQADGLTAAGRALLARGTEKLAGDLAAYGTGPDTFGLIHADLRLANLMRDDHGLWAIDFDDCGFGWWVYDLAAALSFHETDARVPALIARWCDGYARAGSLAAADRTMIPAMILLRRVLLGAWLATRADSDTAATLGGPGFTAGTLALADAYLTDGLQKFRL